MDPKLGNGYPIKAARQAAELVRRCLQYERNDRPSMDEVLETLQKINAIGPLDNNNYYTEKIPN